MFHYERGWELALDFSHLISFAWNEAYDRTNGILNITSKLRAVSLACKTWSAIRRGRLRKEKERA